MSNGYLGNKDQKVKRYEQQRVNWIVQSALFDIEKEMRAKEKSANKSKYGPRGVFYYYVFNMEFPKEEAIKRFLKEYKNYDEHILQMWLEDEEAIKIWKLKLKYYEIKEHTH